MTKIHVHKDLISRIQCDAHRTKYGWLHGSISSHNEGKHIHVKDHFPHRFLDSDDEQKNDSGNDGDDDDDDAQQHMQVTNDRIRPFPTSNTTHGSSKSSSSSDGILGWYLLSTSVTSPPHASRRVVISQRQIQEEEELKVKQTFRQMHIHLMRRLIRDDYFSSGSNSSGSSSGSSSALNNTSTNDHWIRMQNLRKMFGMLIGVMVRALTLNEQQETDQMVQVFKNQVQVYAVYVTDAYMQALYEFAFQSTIVSTDDRASPVRAANDDNSSGGVFNEDLTLRRDLCLIVQTGQMSQFFREQCKTINDTDTDFLSSSGGAHEESYEDALSSFGANYFDIKRVEEFCARAMAANDDMLEQYSALYHENRLLCLELAVLNEATHSLSAQQRQQHTTDTASSTATATTTTTE